MIQAVKRKAKNQMFSKKKKKTNKKTQKNLGNRKAQMDLNH